MNKVASILFSLCFAFSAFSHAQTVVIAAEDGWSPYANADGTGMANEIIRDAFAEVGVEVEYHIYPYARVLHYLDTGAYVAGFNVPIDEVSNSKYILGNTPLYVTHSAYYHDTKRPLQITNREKFNGEVVGVVRGYGYGQHHIELMNKNKITVAQSDSDLTNVKRLRLGRLDSTLIFLKAANVLKRQGELPDNVQIAFLNEATGMYLAFSATHPDGKQLQKQFETGLKKLIENGKRDAILAKY